MTLIIRQATKVSLFLILWLISFPSGVILTSCNTYIKPEESSVPKAPNDTLFLTEAFEYSIMGEGLANIARLKASDQTVRIYAEKEALIHKKIEQTWDSLSKIKKIPLPDKFSKDQEKELKHLAKSGQLDKEFLVKMENQLVNQIKLLETVSTRSEDNEITTLAITLLPELKSQLDTLNSIKEKITIK